MPIADEKPLGPRPTPDALAKFMHYVKVRAVPPTGDSDEVMVALAAEVLALQAALASQLALMAKADDLERRVANVERCNASNAAHYNAGSVESLLAAMRVYITSVIDPTIAPFPDRLDMFHTVMRLVDEVSDSREPPP